MTYPSFLTLAAPAEAEIRVKASRFLAYAFPAADEAEARAIMQERERKYFDARHHCAAWRFRDGVWRAIDAGEPSGSAGPPILAAIDAESLVDTGVVVTRYFGGTKLGVGGLVRAYGDAAAAALEQAPRRRGVPATRLEISYRFDLTAAVMRCVERVEARDIQHGYDPDGSSGVIELVVPAAQVAELASALREATAGALEPMTVGETTLYLPV